MPIDYILECIDTIYKTQNDNVEIRRINVNIAATTVENYKKLKNANIGTYILFQETYHRPTYEKMHPKSIKGNYEYHLTSFDRAINIFENIFDVIIHELYLLQVYPYIFHTFLLVRDFGVIFYILNFYLDYIKHFLLIF